MNEKLKFNYNDLNKIVTCLHEVCNCLSSCEFEVAISANKTAVHNLLDRLENLIFHSDTLGKNEKIEIEFNVFEFEILLKTVAVIKRKILKQDIGGGSGLNVNELFVLEQNLNKFILVNSNRNSCNINIDLFPLEIKPINNVLLAVCGLYPIHDIDSKMLAPPEKVRELLDRIVKMSERIPIDDLSTVTTVRLTRDEIEIILNAISVVYKEIDEWEFGTLFIINIPEMQAVEQKLRDALETSMKAT